MPPDPYEEDAARDFEFEPEDDMEDFEIDDDGGYPFTPANPFGEKE